MAETELIEEPTVPKEQKKTEKPKEVKPKVSHLDELIGTKTELSSHVMLVGFRVFCSKNAKVFNYFKTAEDCERAFQKFYNSAKAPGGK